MYEPKLPPDVVDPELQRVIDWCKEELAAIALDGAALNSLELRTVHAEPAKPREGMIVEADGTDWDPGDGAGQYSFRGGVWVRQHSAGDTFTLANDITDEGALAYLDEAALSDMADLQQNRVIGRNASGTGVPEALSIETVLAWLGNTRGQVLRRGSSTWEALALGAADKFLKSDGTDALWGDLPSPLDLLATLTTTSGTTHAYTGIPTDYRKLYIEIEDVSFSAAGTEIDVAVSGDGGSNYGAAFKITPSSAQAQNHFNGTAEIVGMGLTGSAFGDGTAVIAATYVDGLVSPDFLGITGPLRKHATGAANRVDAIRFGGGTFDAGVIRIYGRK